MSAIDLLPPRQIDLAAAGELLRERLEAVGGEPEEVERTFYDTFDGLVRAEGLIVVHERDRLSLIDRRTGRERAATAATNLAHPLLASRLRPSRLREALLTIVGVRALLPVARLRCRVAPLKLLDAERKTVVRMTIEEPALLAPSNGSSTRLPPRLRMVAVRGYDEELDRARQVLEDALGFSAAEEALVDEAVRVGGGSPGGTSSKVNVPVRFGQAADAAAVAVLRRLGEVIECNLPGTIGDVDPEFLHDLRVAVRRTRAVQRQLRGVFPPAGLEHFRREFRWLQRATGTARDLDVYTLQFEQMKGMLPPQMGAELEPLRACWSASARAPASRWPAR